MEKAVDYLVQHPVLFVIAVIISFMILLSLFKNVMKLVLAAGAVFVLYIAYIYLTGGGIHEAVQVLVVPDEFPALVAGSPPQGGENGRRVGVVLVLSHAAEGGGVLEHEDDDVVFVDWHGGTALASQRPGQQRLVEAHLDRAVAAQLVAQVSLG